MAEGLVNFLLKKLTQDKENLSPSVQEDADFIADELEFMKAFIRVTDAISDQENDDFLQLWLKKVRDVVYDMEDALDDFKVNLVHGDLHVHSFFYSFLHKIACCISGTQVHHQMVASRMQEIKSRVIDISQEHRRYFIKNSIIEKGLSFHNAKHEPALVLEEAEAGLVGIDWAKECLIEWLITGKSDRQVVSVVGVGGLGKSTLAKTVYEDAQVKRHFKFRAWIRASQSFKIEDLLKNLIKQLFHVGKISKPVEVGKDKIKLTTLINQFLRQKRYLIVLDNVCDTYSFDAFAGALPNNNSGSRILLTTRNVIASTNSSDKVYNLTPLSQKDSWSLFCKKIFHYNSCPPQLKNLSEKLLGRCEGLPLAIVTISGILATKDKSRIDEWEMIHRSLGDRLLDSDKMTNMRKILLLSYSNLPYYLKSCFLYFSVFPEGYPINCTRLIRLWIAEGFVNEQGGRTLEEIAESYLNELINRNLVQVVETTMDGRLKRCLIHDLLREIILSKAGDQEFITTVKTQNNNNLSEKVRRISIYNTTPSIHQISSHLRSLLMFWGVDSLSVSPLFNLSFNRLKLLTVLDLEGAPLKEFPNEIVNLMLLKYLSLKKTKVNSIPRSICKLQNLETLNLKHAYVDELPAEILKLQKLHHLLVYRYEISLDDEIRTKYGFKAPAQIGNLQSLQRLCFLEVNQDGHLTLELGKLSQLRRLGIVKLRKEDGKALSSSIERMKNLQALSITSMNESEIIDLEFLCSPPHNLQRLYLAGRLEKLPEWVCSLHSLVKIVLKWGQLSEDPLLSLQHLPNLVHLELVQAYYGKEFYFQQKGFPRLKLLGLNKLQKLEKIYIEKEAMPSLEKLIFQSCHSLLTVPLGIQHLIHLNVLQFINMPIELIMEMDHGDNWKVEHVPEVHFSYFNNGNWDTFSLNGSRRDKNSADLLHKIINI
ncbi:hypothetical protein JCGZ_24943 [Jatropha curcas]|uniref:Uncharacterized protein n=1 Tax=Jatropha curcas TaxID=180498 RepID=A0A067L9Z9_JATCU|nr:hypothetical protein JCGZ_24943 [Jatropha curcas]